jgi:hypothetical protein
MIFGFSQRKSLESFVVRPSHNSKCSYRNVVQMCDCTNCCNAHRVCTLNHEFSDQDFVLVHIYNFLRTLFKTLFKAIQKKGTEHNVLEKLWNKPHNLLTYIYLYMNGFSVISKSSDLIVSDNY